MILRYVTAQTPYQISVTKPSINFAHRIFLIYTKQSLQKSVPTKHPIG